VLFRKGICLPKTAEVQQKKQGAQPMFKDTTIVTIKATISPSRISFHLFERLA
jgi:hypothetical protein